MIFLYWGLLSEHGSVRVCVCVSVRVRYAQRRFVVMKTSPPLWRHRWFYSPVFIVVLCYARYHNYGAVGPDCEHGKSIVFCFVGDGRVPFCRIAVSPPLNAVNARGTEQDTLPQPERPFGFARTCLETSFDVSERRPCPQRRTFFIFFFFVGGLQK